MIRIDRYPISILSWSSEERTTVVIHSFPDSNRIDASIGYERDDELDEAWKKLFASNFLHQEEKFSRELCHIFSPPNWHVYIMKARGNKNTLLEQSAKFQETKLIAVKNDNLTTDIIKTVEIFFYLSL